MTLKRVLFAEHYLGPDRPKDDGYEQKGTVQKQNLMAPMIEYIRSTRASLGVTAK